MMLHHQIYFGWQLSYIFPLFVINYHPIYRDLYFQHLKVSPQSNYHYLLNITSVGLNPYL